MNGQDALFSSASVEWATPQHIFDALDREFHFTLDAAANEYNHKCDIWFGHDMNEFGQESFMDGLTADWTGETIYVNPPYSRSDNEPWARKIYEEAKKGATIVGLVPARVDTKWWNQYYVYAHEIRFVEGRIKFEQDGKDNSATFPSAIVIYRGGVTSRPYAHVERWTQPEI